VLALRVVGRVASRVLHTPNNLAFGVWREYHAKLFGVWRFAPRQIIWRVGVFTTPTENVAFGVLAFGVWRSFWRVVWRVWRGALVFLNSNLG
jgi:hypothetical protein